MKTRMTWIVGLAAVAWAANGVAAQPNPATQPDTAKQADDGESPQVSGANAPGGNQSAETQSGTAKPLPPGPSPAAPPAPVPQTNAQVPGYPPPPPAGYPGYPPPRQAPGPWGYPGYSPYPGYYGYGPPPPPPPVKPPPPPAPPDPTKHFHDGLYFGCSLGPMMLHDSASANDKKLGTASAGGLALSLALGGTPIDGLVLGGTFLGQASVGGNIDPALNASNRDEDTEIGAAFLGGFVDYFFNPRKGFHLQGLVGVQKLSYSYRDYMDDSEQLDDSDYRTRPISSSSGVALGLGAGNLWWIRPQWSIGLVGRLMLAPRLSGTNRFSGQEETHTLITASLGAELVLH